MVSIAAFRKLALSFPGVEEVPHFEKTSFRIKKKIIVTLSEADKRITLKLPPIEQSVFCTYNKSVIYPVPNKWGQQGWTHVELQTVPKAMLADALTVAYDLVSGRHK